MCDVACNVWQHEHLTLWLLPLELACLSNGWLKATLTSGRSCPSKTHTGRTPFLLLLHTRCWGGWLTFNLQWSSPTADTQQSLLGVQVLEKEPSHHTQLGRHRQAPELLSKSSWQALTWRRGRERRNLKTTFPLSEKCAGNRSACQPLRCSCQAVVLLCSPGSTNYTFVFSPGPALLLPQLNTLK